MKKLNIGICDGERYFQNLLQSMIYDYLSENEMECNLFFFSSGEELLLKAAELDVIFLAILLPQQDGYEVGMRVREVNKECKIIIVTATGRFQEAFKINAFRFIKKPIKKEEVEEALQALEIKILGKGIITLYSNRKTVEVQQNEIHYIEAYDSSAEFVLKERKLSRDISLKELNKIFDKSIFFQVNRKQMINILYIKEYKNGVITINEKEIMVSRRRKKEFEQFLKEFEM